MRLAIVALLVLAACDTVHLGDGHGRRTRTALDAQIDAHTAEGQGAGWLDSVDAHATMDKQHSTTAAGATGGGGYGAQGGIIPMIPVPTAPSGDSGSAGSSSGSVMNPIKLEGK